MFLVCSEKTPKYSKVSIRLQHKNPRTSGCRLLKRNSLKPAQLGETPLLPFPKPMRQTGSTARAVADGVLDAAYGYNLGPVLFKPTLTSGAQTFRPTKKGALSYFVGHDADYPLDSGFGIRGWRACESVTSASFIEGDVPMWMGWVTLTDKDGQVTKVDKSWGYKKEADGTLRIVLHHSSLPYQP